MKKYLGIIKIETESMIGVDLQIKSKFSDEKAYLEEWSKLYQNCEQYIMDNNETLQSIFESFEDFTPVTGKEKAKVKEARKLLDEMMKQD